MLHINYLQHIFNIYGQKHAFCLDFCIFAPAIERTVFLCQQSVINDDHKMCRKRLSGHQIEVIAVPSSSNARSMSFEDKLQEWKNILK